MRFLETLRVGGVRKALMTGGCLPDVVRHIAELVLDLPQYRVWPITELPSFYLMARHGRSRCLSVRAATHVIFRSRRK